MSMFCVGVLLVSYLFRLSSSHDSVWLCSGIGSVIVLFQLFGR